MNPEENNAAIRDTFLHVADLHFWRVVWNPFHLLNKRALGNLNVFMKRRKLFAMHAAEPFVEALVEAGGTDVVFTGDFTSTATSAEFALAKAFVDRVRKAGFDIHVMPGNHDVYTFESVRTNRFGRTFGPFLPPAGFPIRRTLPGGTPLIIVPTVCPNLISSRGLIRHHEIDKTADLLAHCGDEPIVVAGHYPMLTTTAGYTMTRERRLRHADDLRQALGKSGKPILFIAGHVHRFSYTKDPDFPNLHHLTTGAFFYRNRHENLTGEFVRIDVKEKGFQIKRYVHTGNWAASDIPFAPHLE